MGSMRLARDLGVSFDLLRYVVFPVSTVSGGTFAQASSAVMIATPFHPSSSSSRSSSSSSLYSWMARNCLP